MVLLPDTWDRCKYCVWQLERAPDTGRLHFQGFLQWEHARSLQCTKRNMGLQSVHLEIARGSAKQNRDYCTKEESRVEGPWEHGELPEQGKRNDLHDFVSMVREQKKVPETVLLEEHASIVAKYPRFVERVQRCYGDKRNWETEVYVLVGPTGTGKTRSVFDRYPAGDIFVYPGRGWFDGYRGQPIVLFDDYYGEQDGENKVEWGMLLKLLDRYPMEVPVKGGYSNWIPRRVYFTSNIPYIQWYPRVSQTQFAALERRITKYITEDFDQIESIVY